MFKEDRRKALYIGIVAVLVITSSICIFRVGKVAAVSSETYEKLGVFTDVIKKIQDSYVEPVETKTLIYGAIKGMLDTLDPHSSFLPPDMYTEMQVDTRGSFGGLGIEISIKDNILTVVSPIEDTPAYKAGIKAGDRIFEIDGKSTKDLALMDAVKKMRGPKGTKVVLTIMRADFTEPKPFTLVRDIINIKSVKWKSLEEGYGMIRISQFQERTTDDLEKGLSELQKMPGGLKGLVLDLRNNPGGLLDQAVKVSDEFIESGLIVYTDGKLENQKMKFEAHKEGTRSGFPMIVIVNGGSASASEIVAGALQDHKRAVILGTQTFGKGSVQTIFPLEDGSGLRLTTARYYTPSGRSIQAKGIVPDIILDATEKAAPETPEQKTRRIREQDLEKHLMDKGETPSKQDNDPKQNNKEKKEAAPPPAADDVQLARALDYLKTWNIFKGSAQ